MTLSNTVTTINPFITEQILKEKGLVSIAHNIDAVQYMKTFPDKYFDWAIPDIEYGIGASRPSRKPDFIKQKNGSKLPIKQSNYEQTDWDFKMSSAEYFDELFRVSKNQIVFGGNYYGLAGGYLVWDKLNGLTDQFDCEMAWLSFTKRTDLVYYLWSGMMQGETPSRNVMDALRQKGDKSKNEKRIHECQKPVLLYEWIISEYKIEGKVLDTHLGSGSNRIANYNRGNDFYSCEISEQKFINQEIRFQNHIKQLTLF